MTAAASALDSFLLSFVSAPSFRLVSGAAWLAAWLEAWTGWRSSPPAWAAAALCSAAAAPAAAAGFLGGGVGTRMSISGRGLVTPPTSLAEDAPSPEIEGAFEFGFELGLEFVSRRRRSLGLDCPVTLRLKSFGSKFGFELLWLVIFVLFVFWGVTPP